MPRRMYKPVSITGTWCALNCKFCGGKYLENMVHVNPANFTQVVHELHSSRVKGLLLSGGFRHDVTLPIEPYIEKIREVKRRLGLVISIHPGLVESRQLVADLRGVVDAVDYEFTTSKYIINDVRGLAIDPEAYVRSLSVMVNEGLHVVPHVFAWHPRIIREELSEELRVIEDMGLKEMTLLVFITRELNVNEEHVVRKVLELTEYVRTRYPGKVYMGCMRPAWLKPALDRVLIENGLVDRIANPYHKLLGECGSVEVYDSCCSIPERLLGIFQSGLAHRY